MKIVAKLDKILEKFNALRDNYDYVLSEGAGGIICPVVWEKDCHLMYLDILKAMKLPCVVVADAGLGTINHTVLTISYLNANDVKVQGVILNKFDKNSIMHQDNLSMIEQISNVKVIATLADGKQDLELLDKNMEDYFDEF